MHNTHTRPGRLRRIAVVVVGLMVPLGLGGCQPGGTQPPATGQAGSTAPAPITTAPPTTVSAEEQVLADYAAFWDAYVAASAAADADHPALAEHATGEALERIRIQLVGAKTAGFVARGEPVRTGTRVTRLDGDTAEVAECLDSNNWRTHDAETGEQQGVPSGRTRQVTARLVLGDGLWRVSVLNIGEAACTG